MKLQKIDVGRLKRLISPLDFYKYELDNAPLKKNGWNNGGLCPFHRDNTPGSFRINTDTGAFVCYSCGTKGGDVIAFCMALHGLSFPDALAKLVSDWGIT